MRPSHLLLLNPVPAFLDTFTPDILHLLSATFKPRNNALVAISLLIMIKIIQNEIVINIVIIAMVGLTLPQH